MRIRAAALASMYLTRRKGSSVQELESNAGVDLVATLAPRKKGGLRQLGVALRYALETVTVAQANKVLRPTWPVPDHGPFPIPVVLFYFTMRENGAWYSWVAEPVVEDEKAKLSLRPEPDCRPLTDDTLEELLDRAEAWYDAHFTGLSAAVSGGKRASGS
jgi:hypothetical protein